MSNTATTTIIFKQIIPFVVLSASPPLAALHASRNRRSKSDITVSLTTGHCARCGTYLLHGQGETRLCRTSKSKNGLRRSCSICGWSTQTILDKGNAPSFPPFRRVRRRDASCQRSAPSHHHLSPNQGPFSSTHATTSTHTASTAVLVDPLSTIPAQPTASSSDPVRAKAKPRNNKSTLQTLLFHNREKQRERAQSDGEAHSLAAFLNGV